MTGNVHHHDCRISYLHHPQPGNGVNRRYQPPNRARADRVALFSIQKELENPIAHCEPSRHSVAEQGCLEQRPARDTPISPLEKRPGRNRGRNHRFSNPGAESGRLRRGVLDMLSVSIGGFCWSKRILQCIRCGSSLLRCSPPLTRAAIERPIGSPLRSRMARQRGHMYPCPSLGSLLAVSRGTGSM